LLIQDAPGHRGAQVVLQFARLEPSDQPPAHAAEMTQAQD
jgi:hypothetical protein